MAFFNRNQRDDDFTIDLDQIPDGVNVPDGVHAARLVGWRKGRSKEGKPRSRLSWKILAGEGAGGVVVTDTYWTEAALQRSKRLCVTLGIDPEKKTVDDYPPIYAEVRTQVEEGKDGTPYVNAEFVRRLAEPPAGCDEQATGEGGGQVAGGGVPGAL